MNDDQQPTRCTCANCTGASCRCGCQTRATQVAAPPATPAACACGSSCPFGAACTCPKA